MTAFMTAGLAVVPPYSSFGNIERKMALCQRQEGLTSLLPIAKLYLKDVRRLI